MKKISLVISHLLVFFIGIGLGTIFLSPPVITSEVVELPTVDCGLPPIIEVIITATPSGPEQIAECAFPTPYSLPEGLYIVDPGTVYTVVESLLSVNPAFVDPRVSCDGVEEGFILADTNICLPKYPDSGFCVEGSEDYPCDMLLVATENSNPDVTDYIVPGQVKDFEIQYMFPEVYEQYLAIDPGIPIELDAVVIPVSSTLMPVMKRVGLSHLASLTFSTPTP